MMPSASIKNLTAGAIFSAIMSYYGPMQMAWGIISPKKSTIVTEIKTAYKDGTRASRKIGSASIAVALAKRRVTSK